MGIIEEVKQIAKAVRQTENTELYGQILDLQSDVMDLLQQNQELTDKLADLQQKKEIENSLHFKNDKYWMQKDGVETGPLCTMCWDADKKLIYLHKADNGYGNEYYSCPKCNNDVRLE